MLIVASFPGSIVSFRGDLIRRIVDAGVDVHVAAPFESLGSRDAVAIRQIGAATHQVELSRNGMNPFMDFAFLFAVYRLIVQLKVGTVLCYTIKPVIYGTLAAWLARVPKRVVLVTGLGFSFVGDRHGFLISALRRLYGFAIGLASAVIFQNKDDRELLFSSGLLSRRQYTAVVNGSGVNLDQFCFHAPPAGQVFLMVSRLLGDKGVREYALAARRVKARHPEVRFLLAGWIDSNPNAISQSELNEWIDGGILEFIGKLDDVRPAMRLCSVYVLPSYREGTPRTVLEAMAIGRAIITTDAPGCRETVVQGENGFLVPVGSVEALVRAMELVLEDQSLIDRMGRKSRLLAEERFDVNLVNTGMLAAIGLLDEAKCQ